VPSEAKADMAASVKASDAPTPTDPKGGNHEEGGKWGYDEKGNTISAPAVSGPFGDVNKPGAITPIDPTLAKNPPAFDNAVVTLGGTWHVHGSGTGDNGAHWVQPPSGPDKQNASLPINIVLGAGNHLVYFYNQSEVTRVTTMEVFFAEPR
jgi:hypothetical protein